MEKLEIEMNLRIFFEKNKHFFLRKQKITEIVCRFFDSELEELKHTRFFFFF